MISDQLCHDRWVPRVRRLTSGGVGLARFAWLSSYVNKHPSFGLFHDVYRPWRRYDMVIFLKSMGPRSSKLLNHVRAQGGMTVFDANVNYYRIEGKEYYRGMLPTEAQRKDATEMTIDADGVIADSEFIADLCKEMNDTVEWVTDSIRMDLVPPYVPWKLNTSRLPLLWCGEAVKLFELLAIEPVLRKYSDHIKLILVTNSLTALDRWNDEQRRRFYDMLSLLDYKIVHYESTEKLFKIYTDGGVFISPRYLDNSYNLGHTEWKITLAMACGRMVLCSPVPSYVTVAGLSVNKGILICYDNGDWCAALEQILRSNFPWLQHEIVAREVVEKYYSTEVVARKHSSFLNRIFTTQVQDGDMVQNAKNMDFEVSSRRQ